MKREEATPGVRVTYRNEDPEDVDLPELRGVIVEPQPVEISYGADYPEPFTPDRHVVVCWDDEERTDASWEDPADLHVIEP